MFDVIVMRNFLNESASLLDMSEKMGRIHPDIIAGLAELGFFGLMRPKLYGGVDLEYQQVMRLVVEASKFSGSLGWCLSLFSFHNMMARRLPIPLLEVLFSSPTTLIASALFPVGRAVVSGDGYVVTGEWRYTSGIHVANWVALRAMVEGEGKPYEAGFYVPASQCQITDDWHTVGMRASGSNSIKINGVFLEKKFRVASSGVEDHRRAEMRIPPSYRLPQQMVISLGTLAPAIGILEAMTMQFKKTDSPDFTLDDFSAAQTMLELKARVVLLVNSFWKEVENALDDVPVSGVVAVPRQMETRLRCSLLMKMALGLAVEIFQQAGSKVIFVDNPLLRMMSDIQALSTHYLCKVDVASADLALRLQQRG